MLGPIWREMLIWRRMKVTGRRRVHKTLVQSNISRTEESRIKRRQSDDCLTMREGHPAFGQKTPADKTADDLKTGPAQ